MNFSKGVWHFYPDHTTKTYHAICNNSHGMKSCALPVKNMNSLIIEGNDSHFIMHGIMMGVIISNSQDITLRNFSIDWETPFCTQAKVLNTSSEYFDVEISNEVPFLIEKETLFLSAEGWKFPFDNFLEFDAKTLSPAYRVKDNGGAPWNINRRVEQLRGGAIRIFAPMTTPPKIGNFVIMRAGDRHSPAIFVENSKNIKFENITVHHAGGMGFVAQKCENVTLKNCTVTPPSGNKRIFSAVADATHFISCRGLIELANCRFESQLDDPCNVHGIYLKIDKLLEKNTLSLKLMHESQAGVEALEAGDKIRYVNHKTLLPIDEALVVSVKKINVECMEVVFDNLPSAIDVGDCIENLEWIPDVHIHDTVARRNRARGFLLTSAGKVRIENNTLSTAGSAIKISGDANQWYESGQVRDVLIRNNTFRDCLFCERDHAVIDIDPEIEVLSEIKYHRNIRIENNLFETFDKPLLFARSVDGLTFKDNSFVQTDTYIPWRTGVKAVEIINS